MPTAKSSKSRKAQTPKEPVYAEYEVEVWDGDSPLTEEWVDQFLGWQSEQAYIEATLAAMPEKKRGKAKVGFGEDYDFKDTNGEKIRCLNNRHNRPLDASWARVIAQIILNKHWRLNGETIVLGRFGSVLSGQHRLIGFKFACQMRRSEKQKYHWDETWGEDPITIDCTIAKGVSEDQDVINTLDNTKPRTIADVLFSDENLFGPGLTRDERMEICKATENAITFLWRRTGADRNKFSGKLTNQEAVSFLARHATLKDAVRIVCGANQKSGDNANSIGGHVSVGVAAGVLYLMGCSATDGERNQHDQLHDYADMEPMPAEKKLDWERWEQAVSFWKTFGSGDESLSGIRYAIGDIKEALARSPATDKEPIEDDGEETDDDGVPKLTGTLKGSLEQWSTGVLALAWDRWLEEQSLEGYEVQASITPASELTKDGFRVLTDVQRFGGIDALGNGSKKKATEAEETAGEKGEEESETETEEVVEEVQEDEAFEMPDDSVEEDYGSGESVEEEAPPAKPKRKPRKAKKPAKAGK